MDNSARQRWLGLLAKAPQARLAQLWHEAGLAPDYTELRAPEIGTAMVRGRAGATGAAFNLGEVTVTRCSVRLADGAVGHGYVQGRSADKARQAALIDALLQTRDGAVLEERILRPLQAEADAAYAMRARKAAATKVEFFTMVRGED